MSVGGVKLQVASCKWQFESRQDKASSGQRAVKRRQMTAGKWQRVGKSGEWKAVSGQRSVKRKRGTGKGKEL